MFKRCLIFVVLLAGVGCALGQDDCKKWAWSNTVNLNINYDDLTWTSWTDSKSYCLYGDVYVVKPGEKADFNVRIVKSGEAADLDIAIVNGGRVYPNQWHFVNSNDENNLRIRFVAKDEDFTIRVISMREWKEWWSEIRYWH